MTRTCERAETTRDCPFSHRWYEGKAHPGTDHPPIPPRWLQRRSTADLTGQVTR